MHLARDQTMSITNLKIENGKWLWLVGALFLASCSSGDSSQGVGALPKSVSAVDETAAIQTLRTVATAQTQSKAIRGSYGDFNSLVQAGLLDQRFASSTPNLRGYRFTMTANENDFYVNADPEATSNQPVTGARHFYLESSDNAVHANANQRASKSDPAL